MAGRGENFQSNRICPSLAHDRGQRDQIGDAHIVGRDDDRVGGNFGEGGGGFGGDRLDENAAVIGELHVADDGRLTAAVHQIAQGGAEPLMERGGGRGFVGGTERATQARP